MSDTSPTPAAPRPVDPGTGLRGMLRRVPLPIRMLIYGTFFLAAVLVGLPWLAARLDVLVPALHVEIGPLRWIGVVAAAAFFALYVAASWVLSARGRGAYVEFDPPARFVAAGPFRFARNPIAASLVGVLLSEALAFSSTGIFALFLLALPLAHLQVVLLEEPLLRRRFGDVYEEYVRRVPRWLPRLALSAPWPPR
jgi:protein-S-isoprenylcysteine O-methyltransferase Ste14